MPILASIFSAVVAGIMYIVWPLVYSALFSSGAWIQGLGAVGAGTYGFANRLLIPTGLHHALNSVFWFDVMSIDDIRKFQERPATIEAAAAATDALICPGVWDGSTCEVMGIIGQYQAGFFPIMMFGLPGAALAIYLSAKTKRRKVVGALMIGAAVASFFTGVTEPLEFSFMFLAPLLYLVHAILTGISLGIASAMGWTAGFGFSAGAVDFLLSSQNPLANQWWILLVMGVAYFFVYLGIFTSSSASSTLKRRAVKTMMKPIPAQTSMHFPMLQTLPPEPVQQLHPVIRIRTDCSADCSWSRRQRQH